MRRVAVTTAVDATVEVLRDEILELGDGDWLGSEDGVLERLRISRPTLRQAATGARGRRTTRREAGPSTGGCSLAGRAPTLSPG